MNGTSWRITTVSISTGTSSATARAGAGRLKDDVRGGPEGDAADRGQQDLHGGPGDHIPVLYHAEFRAERSAR
ncbi:hypothetical protein GCM10009734_24320 [Nonomuraea bangladeshensis]